MPLRPPVSLPIVLITGRDHDSPLLARAVEVARHVAQARGWLARDAERGKLGLSRPTGVDRAR
jgi:hypothetical protein